MRTPSRSASNGSTIVSCAVSMPWASRVTRGGTGGTRSATTRRPERTSSGRTAGVTCRTTRSSIAHGTAADPGRYGRRVTDLDAHHGGAGVEGASPLLGHPLDRHLVAGEELGDGRTAASPESPAAARCASARPRSGRRGCRRWRPRRRARPAPGESAASSAARRAAGSTSAWRPISRYSASLATPVGAALAYEILGWGVNPCE